MSLADLEVEAREDIVIARMLGEIDMSNTSDLEAAIARRTPNQARGVVLDLSEVVYLDSAGIHLIYRLRHSLRDRGQSLRLVIPDRSPVNDALRLAGMGGEASSPTLEAALQTFETG